MKENIGLQRRELCTLVGMAIGFRAFFAVFVDGKGLMNSGWLSLLAGLAFVLPVAALLIPARRFSPGLSGAQAVAKIGGKGSLKALGLVLFAALTYDSALSLRMMTGAVRYIAMPDGGRTGIMTAGAAAILFSALRGPTAAAGAAVMWRRTAALLMGLIVVLQFDQLRPAWITPVMGPGPGVIAAGALPAAGVLSFALAGWLMLSGERDLTGSAAAGTILRSGAAAGAALLVFCMLTPVMPDEPTGRSFRLGRLLANDRAGLSLEMLYVLLMYGGMLTMLLFETTAAAFALGQVFPRLAGSACVWICVVGALGLALFGAAERDAAQMLTTIYFPLIALPFAALGITALVRLRAGKERREEA